MAYLDVEGSRRIYFEQHPGPGRPVVLVHGWSATARCWDTVTPALRARGHQVVLLDLRACGRSDKDFEDVSIAALGSDVARLCEHLELRDPVINGWSLGGAVAVDAVFRLGRGASGLVLTAAPPRATPPPLTGRTAARGTTWRACWPRWPPTGPPRSRASPPPCSRCRSAPR